MFRARLAHLALAAGLGLVSGCSSCYSVTLGNPGGGGLFSRFHQTPAPANGCCPVTPGCGCAASPYCDGPTLDGFGATPGCPCASGPGPSPFLDGVPPVTAAPQLIPAPVSPTVPYAP